MHLVNSIEPKGIHEQERKLDRIMNSIIKSVIRYLSKCEAQILYLKE